MKSNTVTRFASAVLVGAIAFAGVTTPAMAQGRGKNAQAEPNAERIQKNKVQKTTVQRTEASPKSVKVDRSAQRAPKASTVVREPKVAVQTPVRRQPRAVNQAPVVKEPKATRNTGRVRTAEPVVVQRNDKPNRTNTKPLPSRPVQVEDGVIDNRRTTTVDRNRQTNPARVQPSDRVNNRAARVPETVQRTRITESRNRVSTYNNYLIRQNRLANQRRDQLRQQRRLAQARYMEDYWRRLAIQQQQVNQWQSYNYNNDAYFYTPASYRYNYGGRWYETNQYGRRALEQAVNEGYREGYYAGRADREDNWRYNYQSSYAYQDANWGYNGLYVAQSQYNYYFRQGFERGYEDGYYSRSNYGHSTGSTIAILAGVLGTILVLDAIND